MHKRTMKRWLLVRYKLNLLKEEPDVIGRYFETARPVGIRDSGAGAMLHIPFTKQEKAIAMAPGAQHRTKRWPAQYYVDLGKELRESGYEIRLFGSAPERSLCEGVAQRIGADACRNFAGELSLSAAALELAKCEAAVTNDSGLMHLANAAGTRTISLFGPTVREFGFAPRQNAAIVENVGLYCRPCTTHGGDQCPEGHFRCMLELDPEGVLTALDLPA
jgi:heptosyltransferase-2